MQQGMPRLRLFRCNFTRALVCILLASGPQLALAQDTRFAGSWTLAKDQSDFGILPPNFESIALSISQATGQLSITETIKYAEQKEKLPEGDRAEPKVLPARTVRRTYSVWLDGKSHEDIGLKGCKSTASRNGNALDVKLECTTDEGYPVIVTERWTLEKEAQVLKIERTLSSLPSSAKMVLVFQKQP
jgi:hypothetical protein